ncbi:hypothetical protein ACF0H5_009400 [Mactra antiquata]
MSIFIPERWIILQKNIYNEKHFPTKNGAALKPVRWNSFVSNLDDIEEAKKGLSAEEIFDFKHHLGGNWYVGVNSNFPCVNIRKFWLPEGEQDIVPSRKGITLTFVDFT